MKGKAHQSRAVSAQMLEGAGRQQVWKGLHAIAFTLTGLGAAAYLLTALGAAQTRENPVRLLGLMVTSGGALIILAEVKHRRHLFHYFLSCLVSSWISRGVAAMLVFLLLGAGGLAATYLGYDQPVLSKHIPFLAALCALLVMVYQGLVLASCSVAFWRTWFIPLVFLLGNLSGGVALTVLYYVATGSTGAMPPVLRAALILLTAGHLTLVLAHLRFTTPTARGHAVHLWLKGDLAPLFLGGAIALGFGVPAVSIWATYYVGDGAGAALLFLSGALFMVGLVAHRYCLLRAGMAPRIPYEGLVSVFGSTSSAAPRG